MSPKKNITQIRYVVGSKSIKIMSYLSSTSRCNGGATRMEIIEKIDTMDILTPIYSALWTQ